MKAWQRGKGALARPMPKIWYVRRYNPRPWQAKMNPRTTKQHQNLQENDRTGVEKWSNEVMSFPFLPYCPWRPPSPPSAWRDTHARSPGRFSRRPTPCRGRRPRRDPRTPLGYSAWWLSRRIKSEERLCWQSSWAVVLRGRCFVYFRADEPLARARRRQRRGGGRTGALAAEELMKSGSADGVEVGSLFGFLSGRRHIMAVSLCAVSAILSVYALCNST